MNTINTMNPLPVSSVAGQSFKRLRVQLEVRSRQVEAALQSSQKDGMLTVDQALVKQAWGRVSNRVTPPSPPERKPEMQMREYSLLGLDSHCNKSWDMNY